MARLTEVLSNLMEFLNGTGYVPASSGVKIFELGTARVEMGGKLVVQRSKLRDAESFEPRFDELVSRRTAWINVSCYGLFESALVVGIELPRSESSSMSHTSINYSGPPLIVTANSWDAGNVLTIE